MLLAENKLILRRFFEELFNQGNLAVANEIVAADYDNHNPVPGETPGREGLIQFVAYLRRTFPDLRITVEDQVAEGDKVVTRFTIGGTQQGEFADIPPTGRWVTVTVLNIHRVTNGQVKEGWLNWDALGMLQQLGAIPAPQ
ncbi:MAG: ester cyclase [Chloroflexi bacterium]|nr:ester cyclase [Chloroflexota bacterium]